MRIVNPLILGFENMDAANAALASSGHIVTHASAFLEVDSPEVDFMKAMAGYQSLTVVASVGELQDGQTYEELIKAYMPRAIRGLFDGITFVTVDDGIVVAELYRKMKSKE